MTMNIDYLTQPDRIKSELKRQVKRTGVIRVVLKTGIDRASISKALSDKGNPTLKTLQRLAEAVRGAA